MSILGDRLRRLADEVEALGGRGIGVVMHGDHEISVIVADEPELVPVLVRLSTLAYGLHQQAQMKLPDGQRAREFRESN